jgi:hypothetical protein
MGPKRCLACADIFQPSPRVAAQNYCRRSECQRERRKLWQKEKRKADSDYRENQLQCQRRWREAHSDYWRHYRDDHPDYVERNRTLQRGRHAAERTSQVAKMDAILPVRALPSGTYALREIGPGGVAKMDAWVVKIVVLAGP